MPSEAVSLESSLTAASQWLIRSALFAVLSYYQLRQLHSDTIPDTRGDQVNSSVSTIVTPYCTASRTTYCDDFSPSRMRQLAWSLDPAGQTIITPVLRLLHWLSVWRRIEFKFALLIYKSLNGSTPRYLSDNCQLVSDVRRCRLRSSDVSTCMVTRTHTGFGDRAFQVARPRLWNSLPASMHQSDTTVVQFKKLLKTHLFSWDCGALVTVAFTCTAPCTNFSTTTTTTTTTIVLLQPQYT